MITVIYRHDTTHICVSCDSKSYLVIYDSHDICDRDIDDIIHNRISNLSDMRYDMIIDQSVSVYDRHTDVIDETLSLSADLDQTKIRTKRSRKRSNQKMKTKKETSAMRWKRREMLDESASLEEYLKKFLMTSSVDLSKK